jgi:hypothetical protein
MRIARSPCTPSTPLEFGLFVPFWTVEKDERERAEPGAVERDLTDVVGG